MSLSRLSSIFAMLLWSLLAFISPFNPLFEGSLCAQSQDDFVQTRFSVLDMGQMKTRFFYSAEVNKEEDVAEQNKSFASTRHRAGVNAPIVQDQTREWSASASVNVQDIRTEAVLPDTGQRFPGSLWDVRFGTQYRRLLENGWIAGGQVSLGSASDRPFAGYDETTVRATAFTRVPSGERNAWMFFLTYSNNRDFLNHIPLPGFGYLYSPSDKIQLLAGFPFLFFHAGPYEGFSLEAAYFPVRDAYVKLSRRIVKGVGIYSLFQSRHDAYFLADRSDKKQRLFYYEKKAAAGVEIAPVSWGKLDLSGGYAFDRFYFEGENYSDREHNRLNIGDGPFVSARLSISF